MKTQSQVIAIFNQAGGVAKTSLTRDLGFELSRANKRVLLIDADPQGTLGMFLGLNPAERSDQDMFWTAVCTESEEERSPAVVGTSFQLDVGLSNRSLIRCELELMNQQDGARLMSVLEDMRPRYDFILIDCPPKISEISVQVLLASDGLLIPVQTETKAVSNFAEVQLEIAKANRRRKSLKIKPLEVLGVVPTLYDSRYNVHRDHLAALTQTICPSFGYPVREPVRRYIAVSEAGMVGKPLQVYDPSCPANQDVASLANLLLEQKQAGSDK
ncbi:MAG: ParA family protein [Blastocatellia bacterium]|nr:ParA family protein [Blastocatellia bacterium]